MVAVDAIRSGAHDPLINDPDAIYIFIQMDRARKLWQTRLLLSEELYRVQAVQQVIYITIYAT
jgi:hypothetical protein